MFARIDGCHRACNRDRDPAIGCRPTAFDELSFASRLPATKYANNNLLGPFGNAPRNSVERRTTIRPIGGTLSTATSLNNPPPAGPSPAHSKPPIVQFGLKVIY